MSAPQQVATSGPTRPKVMVVHAPYTQRGGEDVVVEAEVALLRENGHAVELFLRPNAALEDQPRWRQATQTLWSASNKRAIAQKIEAFGPDVVHVHNTFPGLSPSIYRACAELGVPVVQTLHNFRLVCPQGMLIRDGAVCHDCVGRAPLPAIRHRCYRDSLAASVVSASMLQMHRSLGTWRETIHRYIVLSDFSKVIYARGGLPADRLVVKPNFVRASDGARATEPRGGFLFVGRLSAEKGLSTLLKACERLDAGIRLRVAGDGPERARLTTSPAIDYLGKLDREQVSGWMTRSECLIVPSVWQEAFGMVVIEAFAAGTPVIASRIGALPEIVEDGRTGLLVPPADAQALSEAIGWAHRNPQRMAEMGRNARDRWLSHYSAEANHERLVSIYRAAMAEARGTRS